MGKETRQAMEGLMGTCSTKHFLSIVNYSLRNEEKPPKMSFDNWPLIQWTEWKFNGFWNSLIKAIDKKTNPLFGLTDGSQVIMVD